MHSAIYSNEETPINASTVTIADQTAPVDAPEIVVVDGAAVVAAGVGTEYTAVTTEESDLPVPAQPITFQVELVVTVGLLDVSYAVLFTSHVPSALHAGVPSVR